MQLDHSEGQVFGLRVNAGPAQLDLVRLASGKTALFEGLEQDLNGAFPEGAATVRNFESPNDAGVGLPHAQADVRGAVQQIAQSGSMTSDASAILQLLLDQNEALQEPGRPLAFKLRHKWLGVLWACNLDFTAAMMTRIALAKKAFSLLVGLAQRDVLPIHVVNSIFWAKVFPVLDLGSWLYVLADSEEAVLNKLHVS